jgi:hypothetical protein
MFESFTPRARTVMKLADEEARGFGHQYIGTEHILLGLVNDASSMGAKILKSRGIDLAMVRLEVENRVGRHPVTISTGELSLTPRAKQVVEYAVGDALNLDLVADIDHLLFGLLHDRDGVAAQILLYAGLQPDLVSREVWNVMASKYKIVESAVRSIRASTSRKRTIRKELLAHLTFTVLEELSREDNCVAAMNEAARRFGDPAELGRELEAALPPSERIACYLERRFGWKPPESAARLSLRLAAHAFCLIAIVCSLLVAGVALLDGWQPHGMKTLWLTFALLVVVPLWQFASALLYFKLRDSLLGARWARKSSPKAIVLNSLIALVALGSVLGFGAVAAWDVTGAVQFLYAGCGIALVAAGGAFVQAWGWGRTEIVDATWACLTIEGLQSTGATR